MSFVQTPNQQLLSWTKPNKDSKGLREVDRATTTTVTMAEEDAAAPEEEALGVAVRLVGGAAQWVRAPSPPRPPPARERDRPGNHHQVVAP